MYLYYYFVFNYKILYYFFLNLLKFINIYIKQSITILKYLNLV